MIFNYLYCFFLNPKQYIVMLKITDNVGLELSSPAFQTLRCKICMLHDIKTAHVLLWFDYNILYKDNQSMLCITYCATVADFV